LVRVELYIVYLSKDFGAH